MHDHGSLPAKFSFCHFLACSYLRFGSKFEKKLNVRYRLLNSIAHKSIQFFSLTVSGLFSTGSYTSVDMFLGV